ncbi:MAG: hypothetical protein ACI9WU_001872, partial [Myxococcota bacterium]
TLHANGQVNADGNGQSTTALALALASTALADTADSPSDWMPIAQAPDKAVEHRECASESRARRRAG